ncbi:MAG: radical SAM protein [Desulfatibacillaceae bacterium]|nr:radical SAM protein [Desulfatibacillaceae bacterium]
MGFSHVFGPVPSRRLGLSLGVDLVTPKVCSCDCVYCECGPTTKKTAQRALYADPAKVIEEIDQRLAGSPKLDFVTFSGFGEPTLNLALGEVADWLAKKYPQYRRALLTNATLFGNPALRKECAGIGVVAASVDSVDEKIFRAVNRPHPDICLEEMLEGIRAFSKDYSGRLLVEFFLVPGLNDQPEHLARMKKFFDSLGPCIVEINTLDRPGTFSWVAPASRQALEQAARILGAVPIGSFCQSQGSMAPAALKERILEIISRRPCTVDDLVKISGASPQEIEKLVAELATSGLVTKKTLPRGVFFLAQQGPGPKSPT